jgi:hypothetical protein
MQAIQIQDRPSDSSPESEALVADLDVDSTGFFSVLLAVLLSVLPGSFVWDPVGFEA